MLSKVELKFLESPETFDQDYSRVLRYRIKAKKAELLKQLSSINESNLSITEFCNGQQKQQTLNQAAFQNLWSLRRDLDPRPLPYQGNAPPG
jgi:hypothetical protein